MTERSSDNFHEFHGPTLAVESIGPFHQWRVTVNGFTVPHLEAKVRPGGEQVTLTLDNRISIDVPHDQAETTIAFLADCIAVAKGYACHPRGRDAFERQADDRPTPRRWPWSHMVPAGGEDVS